jgi:alpha-L-fucosidase
VITYTTDGSEPDSKSPVYSGPFEMPGSGVVKARAYINDMQDESAVVTAKFDICPAKWKVISVSDESEQYPASNAVDGEVRSMWHTPRSENAKGHPHYIVVDMGELLKVKGFTYTPRAGSKKVGTVSRYDLYLSRDGKNWKKVKSNAEFANIKNNPVRQEVLFGKTYTARYFKFVTRESINNEKWASVGELGVITD